MSEKSARLEKFVQWMILEAKASREGLPVDPEVEPYALFLDDWMRGVCEEFIRFANENAEEIERFGKGMK